MSMSDASGTAQELLTTITIIIYHSFNFIIYVYPFFSFMYLSIYVFFLFIYLFIYLLTYLLTSYLLTYISMFVDRIL